MQRIVATLATRLLSSSSSEAKNIRARMKEKEMSMNPRVASGSATDCCMGLGWGKAHGPSTSMMPQVTASLCISLLSLTTQHKRCGRKFSPRSLFWQSFSLKETGMGLMGMCGKDWCPPPLLRSRLNAKDWACAVRKTEAAAATRKKDGAWTLFLPPSLPPSVCFAPAVYVDTPSPLPILGFADSFLLLHTE